MLMPFGKYRGEELEDIPEDYLRWLLHNVKLRDPRLRAEVEELVGEDAPEFFPEESGWTKRATGSGTTQAPPAPPVDALHTELADAVNAWWRKSARLFHPDRGGSDELMKAINEGGQTLLAAIEEAFNRRR